MFETLYELPELPAFDLPAAVAETYGRLGFGDAVLYANFVASLDGVVAFEPAVTDSAGRLVSGGSPADRFLMGLLRACADAIVVGAGTARDEAGHVWTPERASPAHAADFAAVRRRLGLAPAPEVFIVTASGRLDASAAGVRTSTVVTTAAGATALAPQVRERALVLGAGDRLDLGALLAELHSRGHRRVLTEGGPRVMGALLEAGLVDELFLSLSPVVAGRDGPGRPGLAEGGRLLPQRRVSGRLLSLRRSDDGLVFLRYSLDG